MILAVFCASIILVNSQYGATVVNAVCSETFFPPPFQQQLMADDSLLGDRFGLTVAIDKSIIVACSPEDDGSGSAYVFGETAPGSGEWIQLDKLIPSDPGVGDFFGASVATYNSSYSTIVIGSPINANVGAAYVFRETVPGSGVWTQLAKLAAGDPYNDYAGDEFGAAVDIYDSTIVVGSWLDDDLGTSSGSLFVFRETTLGSGVWTELEKFSGADTTTEDLFGWSVAMYGSTIVAGSRQSNDAHSHTGNAYVFGETSPGSWEQLDKLAHSDISAWNEFGFSLDIHGTTIVVGAWWKDALTGTRAGGAYVFDETAPGSGDWVEIVKLVQEDPRRNDYFGYSVAIYESTIVVSMHNDEAAYSSEGVNLGAAYVFRENTPGSNEWFLATKLAAPDPVTGEALGIDVAVYESTVVLGTWAQSLNTGAYIFNTFDDCPGNACEHGATCIDGLNDYCCVCPPGFGGEFCTDCICENGGVCQDDPVTGIGYCDCSQTNWYGDTCSNKFCNNGVGADYPEQNCNCTFSGATGKFCTKDIDDCVSSPCINGGTCFDNGADFLPNHAHEFNCSCAADYYGPICSDTLCYSSPCLNNGTCGNGRDIACNCTHTGYEGIFCETESDECASSPCLNDGVCTDLLRGFSCDCDGTGYGGTTCFKDVDDCASSPCLNDGACQDKGVNKFKCTCDEFWEGKTCEINIDDCVTNACQNEAICVDGLGNYTCNCTMEGYEGEFCDMESDECASSPCEHDGVCIDLLLDFSCDCTDLAYEGELCKIYIPCLSLECQNGGTCDNDVCLCPNGYTGEFCEETLEEPPEDAEPIVFEMSFASFARDDDTAESFALELPLLLAEATPGTVASDFEVRVLDNDEQISYEVTFQNYQELELAEVQDAVEDAPFVEERINGDIIVESQIEEEEEEEKKEEEDMTWLIIVLVLVGIVFIVGGGSAAKVYHDKQQESNLGIFKADKMNMPV